MPDENNIIVAFSFIYIKVIDGWEAEPEATAKRTNQVNSHRQS